MVLQDMIRQDKLVQVNPNTLLLGNTANHPADFLGKEVAKARFFTIQLTRASFLCSIQTMASIRWIHLQQVRTPLAHGFMSQQ